MKVEPICSAKGVTLYAESDSFISFLNSPYVGHRNRTAVDIYPALQEWNSSIHSPIHGKVIFSKKMKMGAKRKFPSEEFDHAIGIQSDEESNTIVRVLHCKPVIEIGQQIETGDLLGTAIRSRYFNYWTGPHAHVDVLEKQHFQRSTQSFPLDVVGNVVSSRNSLTTESLTCQVVRVAEDYVIGVSKDTSIASDGRLFGHSAHTMKNNLLGIIDAGLPHYKLGGIYANNTLDIGERITGWKTNIGKITLQNTGISLFSMNNQLGVFLDETPVKGISCFLYSKCQLIKGQIPIHIIPQQYGSLPRKLQEGDSFTLTFSESNSDVVG